MPIRSLSAPTRPRSLGLGLIGALGLIPSLAIGQDCSLEFVGGDVLGNSPTGGLEPSLSADGRFVAYLQGPFPSHAFVHDRADGTKAYIDSLADGTPFDGSVGACSLAADGRHAAFLATTTMAGALGTQVYHKDLDTGALEIISVTPDGTPMTPTGVTPSLGSSAVSADGNRVVFGSTSVELVPGKTTLWTDPFVRDLALGMTFRIVGNGGLEPDKPMLEQPALSANGRYVAYTSRATNLVEGDTNGRSDIFVYDFSTGLTERVSVSSNGTQGNLDSEDAVLSANGRYVAFISHAFNLVAGDTNGVTDVFVHDRATRRVRRVNVASDGTEANSSSFRTPSLSARGRFIVFHSTASNLVGGSTGAHLYRHDLFGRTTVRIEPTSPGENDRCSVSADGRTVAFASLLPYGPADVNGQLDVYVRSCAP